MESYRRRKYRCLAKVSCDWGPGGDGCGGLGVSATLHASMPVLAPGLESQLVILDYGSSLADLNCPAWRQRP